MDDCIFCKIGRHEHKADVVYEDDDIIAFRDIHPKAFVHVLVIPKEHIASFRDLEDHHRDLAGGLLLAARDVAKTEGEQEGGYRLSVIGTDVPHLHIHVLGGRQKEPLA